MTRSARLLVRLPGTCAAFVLALAAPARAQTVLPEFAGRGVDRTLADVFNGPGARSVGSRTVAEFAVPLDAGQVLRAELVSSGPGTTLPDRLFAITAAGDTVRLSGSALGVFAEGAGTVRLVATGVRAQTSRLRISSFLASTLVVDDVSVGPAVVLPSDGGMPRSAAAALSFEAVQDRPVLLSAEAATSVDPRSRNRRRDVALFVFENGGYERGHRVANPLSVSDMIAEIRNDGPGNAAEGFVWVPQATGRYTLIVSARGRPADATIGVRLLGVTGAALVPPDTLAAWGARRGAGRAAAGCPAIAVDLLAGSVNGLTRLSGDQKLALTCPDDRDTNGILALFTRGLASLGASWTVYAKSDAAVTPDVFGTPVQDALGRLGLARGRAVLSGTVSRATRYGCLRLSTDALGDVHRLAMQYSACPAD